jgi:hypothetical protein
MMSTSRILIWAATTAFLAAQALAPAQASTVTYDLTLSTIIGVDGGTGILTVNGPVSNNTFTPGSGGLISLSLFIDGGTFTLNNALPGTSATFKNGILTSLLYWGNSGGDTLGLFSGGGPSRSGYILSGPDDLSFGTFSGSPVSATPLPPTWTMMLIGLAGFGFMLYRRNRRDSFAGVVPA